VAPINRGGQAIAFRPYVGISGIYDSQLIPVSVNSEGTIPLTHDIGIEGNAGIYGYKPLKRTLISLAYRATFRHFNQQSYYDETDQYLDLGVGHQVSRRLRVDFRETAGSLSRYYGLYSTASLIDPDVTHVSDPLFDNRTLYLSTTGMVQYQKSLRLSFSAGGQGYLVRRRSSSLYGVTGAVAHGDMAYRLNRTTTIGVAYMFTHFGFTKGFGTSNLHAVFVTISKQLSRYWQAALMAGGMRVESLSLAQVTIDPVIAAIIGQNTGIRAVYTVVYVPSWQANLSRRFHHGLATVTYSRTVTPGNGVYLTSRSDTGGVVLSYTALKNWNFGGSIGYTRLGALAQNYRPYTGYNAGFGITRRLLKSIHADARVDARQYRTTASFHPRSYRATVGFTWSPGETALRLW